MVTRTYATGTPFSVTYPIGSKYCRVVYTNGVSAQGSFNLKTLFFRGALNTRVSYVNSTTTPLAESATFTGQANYVILLASTDVPSGADGFLVSFSDDKTTFPYSKIYKVTGKYVKVTYTNSGAPQTDFTLQTLLVNDFVDLDNYDVSLNNALIGEASADYVFTGTSEYNWQHMYNCRCHRLDRILSLVLN